MMVSSSCLKSRDAWLMVIAALHVYADDLLEVATAFKVEHKLPESYTERIVDFMRQAMGQ